MKMQLPFKTILLFVGSFVLINAAMYFLLKGTQPKSAIPSLSAKSVLSDSTVHGTAATRPPVQTAAEVKKDTMATGATSSPPAPVETATQQEMKEPPVTDISGQEGSQMAATEPAETYESAGESQGQTEPDAESDESGEPDAQMAPSEEQSNDVEAEDLSNVVTEGDPRQVKRLAKLLEAMKPQQAALIVTRLPEDTIVAVFMRMRERPAAKILALLPVEQAARVSQHMIQMVSSG